MLKKVFKFILQYKLFSIALLGVIVAVVLWFLNLKTISDIVLATISVIELIPILKDMYEDIRNGTYGIDILAATAIGASVLLHQYWAAIIVVIMLTGGESLDEFANHRARSELDTLLKNSPKKAHLLRSGKIIDVKADSLKIGDKFVVKPGEIVPVDGIVIDGNSSFNEASLTGESTPVYKNPKDQILSGSVNLEGLITAQASASAEDSQYQQIIKLVESAAASQSPFVRLADRYSIPFTVMAYLIAGAVWYLTGQPIRFLEVIIVATPCPLLLAAPIALVSGMSLASRHGVIVKTGAALEKLAEAKTIAFDKTGTLTHGELEVDDVIATNHTNQKELATLAASLEQFSSHIVAKSIVNYTKKKNFKLLKVKNLKEEAGMGLIANLRGDRIIVGRFDLLKREGISVPNNFEKLTTVSKTSVFVSRNDQLLGYITLNDEIRKEAKKTVTELMRLGIKHVLMVTGDNAKIAKTIASKIAIKEVVAEALPADKLRVIENVKNKPVVFVGDGVNDAPVLTASDVGIALGAKGSTAASESADMVIMQDDITKVVEAYKISLHTFKIARQSILTGIALSLILMLIFASGKFMPVYGAVIQEVVDVVVIFNALRAHKLKNI